MLCEEWEISSGASTEGLKKEGNWKFLLNEIRYKKIWDEKYIFLTFPELPPSPHLTLLWIPPLFFGYVSYFPRLCKNLERYLQWILCYLLLVLYDSKAIHMRRWTSPLWIREANFRECAGGIGWRRKREGWNEKWWRFFFLESSQRRRRYDVWKLCSQYTHKRSDRNLRFFSLHPTLHLIVIDVDVHRRKSV